MEHRLPPEVWHAVVDWLEPWSALQLRATCTALCRVVSAHQPYWYRHFTWYLCKKNKRDAVFKTGCRRWHRADIPQGFGCLTPPQELELSRELGVPLNKLEYVVQHNPEVLRDQLCQNPGHYVYAMPRSHAEIPLDPEDYQPGEQVYLYRFLIHNYRCQREALQRRTVAQVKAQLSQVSRDLFQKRSDLEAAIASYQRSIATHKFRQFALRETLRRMHMLDDNRVFFDRRSRTHRGVLALLDKRRRSGNG